MVTIVFGLPGSGKSYFASRLAARLNALYLNSDEIRKELTANRTYSFAEKTLVYDKMLEGMNEAIGKHQDIVLDATFYRSSTRERFIEAASQAALDIQFIEVRAKTKIIKERLSKKREYSEADYGVYLKLKKLFQPLKQKHLTLYSQNDNIETMLTSAIQYLNQDHG